MVPVQDAIGDVILDHDEFIRPQTTMEGLAALKTSFDKIGEMGYDAVAIQRYPQVERRPNRAMTASIGTLRAGR